ncbi:MAG: lipid A biosynthesis acyltransferase [Flavobacterium sp.]|nr:lipid A biosynthesis acyltransferase [Flavobacterium sp.]
MDYLLYIALYPIIWFVSIMPFPILYFISDCLYIVVYYIIGYRKDTVKENLLKVFPHLSDKERLLIEKKSYHHLCDTFLEMAKTMTISTKEINKRYVFTNIDTFLELEKKGKNIVLMCAHYASYEWLISINTHVSYTGYAIYKKIENKYFDKLVRDIRSKFNSVLITTKQTKSTINQNHIDGKFGVYGFASDQTPRFSKNLHWYTFLGIETPIHVGAEILAKQYDMNVLFLNSKKIKRGFYEVTFDVMTEEPQSVSNFELSELFIRKVEKQIYEAPEYYMWTHKRWKHVKS